MASTTLTPSAGWSGTADTLHAGLQTLRSTAELRSCSDRQLRSLLPYFDEVTVPAGQRIAIEGRLCSEFLVVMWGRLRVRSSRDGDRVLHAGDSYGWRAMWERAANQDTVVAESDTRVLVAGHAQFRHLKSVGVKPGV
jgi:CRP-like cAMP-binding protein